MTVNELIEKTGFEIVNLANKDRVIEGGFAGDLLSWVMGRASEDNVWVTIMTNQNIIAVATLIDLSCIVIAENSEIDNSVVTLAKEKGVNILKTADNTFSVCGKLASLI